MDILEIILNVVLYGGCGYIFGYMRKQRDEYDRGYFFGKVAVIREQQEYQKKTINTDMDMKGYKTSKDYKRLRELLDAGHSVVCFTTYDCEIRQMTPHEPMMVTDVCMARLLDRDNQYAHYNISCRGVCYVTYWINDTNKLSFEDVCEREDIEFIEPDLD